MASNDESDITALDVKQMVVANSVCIYCFYYDNNYITTVTRFEAIESCHCYPYTRSTASLLLLLQSYDCGYSFSLLLLLQHRAYIVETAPALSLPLHAGCSCTSADAYTCKCCISCQYMYCQHLSLQPYMSSATSTGDAVCATHIEHASHLKESAAIDGLN
jgi:hypothetical protein